MLREWSFVVGYELWLFFFVFVLLSGIFVLFSWGFSLFVELCNCEGVIIENFVRLFLKDNL